MGLKTLFKRTVPEAEQHLAELRDREQTLRAERERASDPLTETRSAIAAAEDELRHARISEATERWRVARIAELEAALAYFRAVAEAAEAGQAALSANAAVQDAARAAEQLGGERPPWQPVAQGVARILNVATVAGVRDGDSPLVPRRELAECARRELAELRRASMPRA
jgi:hypothetical protein